MTERKLFKRLVRERAERLGISYSTALRHVRTSPTEEHMSRIDIAAPPERVWTALDPKAMRVWRTGWQPPLPGDPDRPYVRIQQRHERLSWAFRPSSKDRSEVDV